MKKGIVMEKHRRYMIVMTENGVFQKALLMKNADIGQEVHFTSFTYRKWLSFFFYLQNKKAAISLFVIVYVLFIVTMPIYFSKGKDKTFAYVNIDINPSVELTIDNTLHVRTITPLNKDANKLLHKKAKYKNEDLKKVIAMIMNWSEEEGLVDKEKNMLVGVSFVKEEDAQEVELLDKLKHHLLKDKASWKIATFVVPQTVREKAEKKSKTMNEAMAREIVEKSSKKNVLKKEDKAMIETFYYHEE